MLDEVGKEVLGGLFRFLGRMLLEVVLEAILRGPGYLLCRLFRKDVDPESGLVVVVGLSFWLCAALGAWYLYGELSTSSAIDRCLDAGGAYDRSQGQCLLQP